MIEEISTNGYLNRGGIIAGDFNMLDDPLIDCERGEYAANAGFKAWRAAASKKGLTDAYRKFHGYEAKSGFTRRHGTNYTGQLTTVVQTPRTSEIESTPSHSNAPSRTMVSVIAFIPGQIHNASTQVLKSLGRQRFGK